MLRSVGALVSPRNIRVAPRGGAAVFRESTKNVRPFLFRPGRMTGRPATRQQRGASPRASPRDPRRGSEPCPSTRRRSTRTAIYRINNMPFRRRSTRGSRRLRGASARRSPSASRERVSTRDARRFTGRGARRDARRSSITGRLRETRRARNPCLRCERREGRGAWVFRGPLYFFLRLRHEFRGLGGTADRRVTFYQSDESDPGQAFAWFPRIFQKPAKSSTAVRVPEKRLPSTSGLSIRYVNGYRPAIDLSAG